MYQHERLSRLMVNLGWTIAACQSTLSVTVGLDCVHMGKHARHADRVLAAASVACTQATGWVGA
jgi:hypothetical protein